MPLRIGDMFAGYRVLRLFGSGGMGELQPVLHPDCPVKTLSRFFARTPPVVPPSTSLLVSGAGGPTSAKVLSHSIGTRCLLGAGRRAA